MTSLGFSLALRGRAFDPSAGSGRSGGRMASGEPGKAVVS